ncbi:HD domain-containing phosphohydrolase [Mesotoga sp.]|uniref:HD domain-containing phosphohydrolase n=1 Tax=Mesotoga sp. TaxID=2053577 RepID=UPI00356217A4
MSKDERIRILFAEDLHTDVDLARRKISRVFPEIEVSVVDTEQDFVEKLEAFRPDLVISDYMMPTFDGMRVIELVLEKAPEIPVIILTGSMNEDTAAECMKAGAVDYVIKEHMARLPYAVVEAMEKKEIKLAKERAEKALVESEKKFRLLAENAKDLIYRYELNEKEGFSYVSPSSSRITGYFPCEFYKDPDLISKIVHPEDEARLLNLMNDSHSSNQSEPLTLRWMRKDGKIIWIEQQNVRVFDDDGKLIAIEGIARDVTERQESAERITEAFYSIITVVSDILTARDPYSGHHHRNVSRLSSKIAEKIGLDDSRIEAVKIAGLLHDIGKIAIPAEILSKPGSLNEEEYSLIQEHSIVGYNILKNARLPWPVAEIVRQHHERLDGSGYPGKLKGSEICVEARIIAVVDVVDAMTSHRPYRPAHKVEAALEEIHSKSGTCFDSSIVNACTELIEEGFDFREEPLEK